MEVRKVPIPPTTDSILAEINRTGVTWESALGDMIDNSLDAGASRVVVKFDKKNKLVDVIDNGSGCPEPEKMLQNGYTTKRGKRNMLGRYGIGLKQASFFMCGELGSTVIITSNAGTHRRVRVSWNEIIKSGIWEIDEPCVLSDEEVKASLPETPGTVVSFRSVRRQFLTAPQLNELARSFAFTFSPALKSGRQIEFDVAGSRHVLAAARDPAWSESTAFDVEFGGKTAHVRAGIKSSGDRSGRSGMSFSYGHRVVLSDTAHGLGDYSKEGFAGIVELEGKWDLGSDKMSVTDEHFPELCSSIADRIGPMLEKIKQASVSMQTEAVRVAASSLLTGALQTGRTKQKPRGPGGKSGGSKKPKPETRGEWTADGGVRAARPMRIGGEVHVFYYDDPSDPRGGYAEEQDRGLRVNLNTSKPYARKAVGNVEMVCCLAWPYLAYEMSKAPESSLFKKRAFHDALGDFYSLPISAVGEVTKAVAS